MPVYHPSGPAKNRPNLHQKKLKEKDVELHDDNAANIPGDDDEVNKHGPTVLTHVWGLPEGKRVLVKCNQLGQPIEKEGGLLGKFLGTIARNGGYCPLDVKDWRKVKKDNAETIIQLIQAKFLYPRSCEKWILKSIGRDWRKYKATLKKTLFNPKKKISALYKLCPDDVDDVQWISLVRFWKSKEGKALSERNKISREMKKTTHTAGTKSYARWSEDMRQEDPEKMHPHRAKVYIATHRRRAKGTNEPVVEVENLIEKHLELAQNNQGRVAWKGDALDQVLGEEKPGQVHGLGLVPIPKQVYGQTSHHFEDINVATIDGSPSDVETHLLEEINQLKEHSKQQDQVIQELLNKRTHHQNKEPSVVYCQEIDQGKFQQEVVVHTRRKRVRCNRTNQDNAVSEESDEMYHNEDNYKELSHQEDELSPSPCFADDFGQQEFDLHRRNSSGGRKNKETKMSKKQFQDTTSMDQHEVPHDKTTRHKTSDSIHPPIKVGSTVLLKTAKYPNKAIVAYATLLSSSLDAKVGGVDIGNQFCKVCINHPTEENEPLVRPMSHYKLIGDTHAKGVPIAWPSICVEMING